MIDQFQYFNGYLRIRVWGFSPERFMNLCGSKDILLWDIERDGEGFLMNISLKNFYRLRPIARKTGVRVAIRKRYGLPFFAPVVKKRKVFAAGFLAAAAFWVLSSFFVWDVVYEGNFRITADLLDDFLKTEEVKAGMLKRNLDIDRLEKDLRKTFPEITWTSIRLLGVRLVISVKENDAPIMEESEKRDMEQAADLVADFDGTVVSILVRSGIPKVAAGAEVKAGDILVEGLIPIYNDDQTVRTYNLVEADADVWIEHSIDYADSLAPTYVERVYTGREQKKYFLKLFKNEIKLPDESPYLVYDSVIRVIRPAVFEKLSIPVYLGENTYREYMNVEYKYSVSQVKEELTEKFNRFLEALFEKGVQIIEKSVKISHNGDEWIIEGQLAVRERAMSLKPSEGF